MSDTPAFSRRAMLATPALLAFGSSSACAQDSGASAKGSNILVAYLSRSGNTRVIAETLQRELRADLFEIRTATPYPADYEAHVGQATRERDNNLEPPLAALVDDIAAYTEVYLGFPIWGQTAPAPIRTFLKTHNLSGKTLRPFITHGGFGIGSAATVLSTHAPSARIQDRFVLEADQERRTLNQIRSWLAA